MYVYLNNRTIPSGEARVSVFDHGFLYGDGIYETMRVYDGVVFMFDEHIERLHRSASLIHLDLPKDSAAIKMAVYDTLKANYLTNAYVRVTVSRGHGPIGLDPALCKEPTFVVIATDFKDYPRSFYDEGIKLMIVSVRRNIREALNPQIKSLNFLNNILAKIETKQTDSYEALMLNSEGYLAEGAISNIFFVRDKVLCTPSIECGILDGITRGLVLAIAARSGVTVEEGDFAPEDLYLATEVFVTNTTMEVMPVSRVDAAHFDVGEITKLLMANYRHEVKAYVREKKGESPSLWQ
jgi:branched-chain amino acid aminotransferase